MSDIAHWANEHYPVLALCWGAIVVGIFVAAWLRFGRKP